MLESFNSRSHVAVIGGSGGIGRSFVELLASDVRVGRIHALSREPIGRFQSPVRETSIDLLDEPSIRRAAGEVAAEGPLDLVIVATGILHRTDEVRPERSIGELDSRAMQEVFAVNSIGPALVAKYFLPLLRTDAKAVFAALSARVGSIGDNRLGGWASYRASKAALNMLIRTFAIEQARRAPRSIVVSLHPGTVDTPLSSPFTRRVPPSSLFAPTLAARHLLAVLDRLTAADSGGFFAWDATRIEY